MMRRNRRGAKPHCSILGSVPNCIPYQWPVGNRKSRWQKTYDHLTVLIRVDQRLNKVVLIFGQHIVALAECQRPHDVVRQVRKPSRHVLIASPEGGRVLDPITEHSDLIENYRLIGPDRRVRHCVRDDSSFSGMNMLVGCARQVLFAIRIQSCSQRRGQYLLSATASLWGRACRTWPEIVSSE